VAAGIFHCREESAPLAHNLPGLLFHQEFQPVISFRILLFEQPYEPLYAVVPARESEQFHQILADRHGVPAAAILLFNPIPVGFAG
jgi:hypothetical protein